MMEGNMTEFANSSTVAMYNGTENGSNETTGERVFDDDTNIWDKPSVRITFVLIHCIVFFFCFLGNFTVILVVTLHWKMRSITNFCLANLAVADLCVAIFCVFQNLYAHMSSTWALGTAICKIYHFINEMSLTASVLILVVISIERYLAIIHPMRCKSWLTLNRLRLTIGTVWGISVIYSIPRLYYTTVFPNFLHGGIVEYICAPSTTRYNYKLFDAIHMSLLFFFPLLIISILYTIIGIALWKSSKSQHLPATPASESSSVSDGVDGNIGGGLLGPGKRRRGPSCKEILCCSFSCCRRLRNAGRFLFICLQRRRASASSGGCKELRNGISSKKGNTNEAVCEFNSLRPQHHSPTSSSYSPNQREFGSSRITNTREPIVVIKFEKLKKRNTSKREGRGDKRERSDLGNSTTTTKHCKILMKVSNPSESTNVEEIGSERTEVNFNQRGCSSTTRPVSASELREIKDYLNKSHVPSSPTLQSQTPRRENEVKNANEPVATKSFPTEASTLSPQNLQKFSRRGDNPLSPRNQNPQRALQPHRIRRGRILRAANYGTKALEARRKIIKMLIVIVLTFALCNLPFHARKIWQNWCPSHQHSDSEFGAILTQVTTLIRYANSAINPLLYAFMSAKFRQSLIDFLFCRLRRPFRTTRNFSVRSTNVIPLSMAP